MFGNMRVVVAAFGALALLCVFFPAQDQRQTFVYVPVPQQQQYAQAQVYAEPPPQFMYQRSAIQMNEIHTGPGKGFGGGEATRDPAATQVDPNDPKGKQQAIHKAESFADYLERRKREQR
jgi:hypothetical protein